MSHACNGGAGPGSPGRCSAGTPRWHWRLEQQGKAASSLNKEKGESHLQGEEEVRSPGSGDRAPGRKFKSQKGEDQRGPEESLPPRAGTQAGQRKSWQWEGRDSRVRRGVGWPQLQPCVSMRLEAARVMRSFIPSFIHPLNKHVCFEYLPGATKINKV